MEIWKDVVGANGHYQVSDLGRYKGCNRWVSNNKGQRLVKEKILKGSIVKGYRMAVLNIGGVKKGYYIHQLVAMAFLGHEPNGLIDVVDHINSDKLDNRLVNLRIVSSWVNSTEWRDKKTLGISYYKNRHSYKKWGARITFNGKRKHLGYYLTKSEASKAYNNFCIKNKII